MSYTITISGDADSKEREREVLVEAIALVEHEGAKGEFSFSGDYFSVRASAPEDAVGQVKALLGDEAADAEPETEEEPSDV